MYDQETDDGKMALEDVPWPHEVTGGGKAKVHVMENEAFKTLTQKINYHRLLLNQGGPSRKVQRDLTPAEAETEKLPDRTLTAQELKKKKVLVSRLWSKDETCQMQAELDELLEQRDGVKTETWRPNHHKPSFGIKKQILVYAS